MTEPEGTAATLAGASSTSPDVSSSPAEPTPEQEADAAFTRALFAPKPATAGLAAALGLVLPGEAERHEQPPPQDEAPPDFDGGVREPAPGPTDPFEAHNELVMDLFRNTPSGGGQQW